MHDDKIKVRFQNQAKSKTFNNIIQIFQLDTKSVLDIGCSYGEFLVHFGFDSLGLSINPNEVDYGVANGLNIVQGNIEEPTIILEDKKFDVIFANNIFEHLYSPHHFLVKIKHYLKDGGFLILGVPVIPGIKFLVKMTKFRGSMANGHINFFTKFTLENTVKVAGWDVEVVRGFHFKNKFLDKLLNPIYPHFYVVAKIDHDFTYSDKRKTELVGYHMDKFIK